MDCVFTYLGEAMNVDEITLMARKAGFVGFDGKNKSLCKFAELVEATARANEREECAAMCMAVPRTGAYFARLIRARGTT